MAETLQSACTKIGCAYGYPTVYNRLQAIPEVLAAQVSIEQTNLEGQLKNYIKLYFTHSCNYNRQRYTIPMTLFIDNMFPGSRPILYIVKAKNTKILSQPGVVDENGRVIVNEILPGNVNLIAVFQHMDAAFQQQFPICQDRRAINLEQLSSKLHEDYFQVANDLQKQDQRVKTLEKEIKANTETLEDALDTVGVLNTSLNKQKAALETSIKRMKDTIALSRGGSQTIEENYRRAFAYGSDMGRLFIELSALETACKDAHDLFSGMLCTENSSAVLPLMRENARQLFEAKYLKDIVRARINITPKSGNPSLVSQVGPPIINF